MSNTHSVSLIHVTGKYSDGDVACYLNDQQIACADPSCGDLVGPVKDIANRLARAHGVHCETIDIAASDGCWTWDELWSDAKEKLEIAKTTDPATSLRNADDQYRALGVSTAHITESDCLRLTESDHSRIAARETGAFVKLYPYPPIPHHRTMPGFSDHFYAVLNAVQKAGYNMVEFDADADTHNCLPVVQ